MTIGRLVLPLYAQMLEALLAQLHKAYEHVGDRADYETLADRRLYENMFPLRDQIRFICIQASEVVARLAGRAIADIAQPRSLAEAENMVVTELAEIGAVREADLDAGATKQIRLELDGGLVFELSGEDYVRDWAIPQFFFHLVTAYAIMRTAGVPLGKIDYVGHMFRHRSMPATGADISIAAE